MRRFEQHFTCWPLSNNVELNIAAIFSKGSTLKELLDNAEVYIEDWNGNTVMEGCSVGDLSSEDFEAVQQLFVESL